MPLPIAHEQRRQHSELFENIRRSSKRAVTEREAYLPMLDWDDLEEAETRVNYCPHATSDEVGSRKIARNWTCSVKKH